MVSLSFAALSTVLWKMLGVGAITTAGYSAYLHSKDPLGMKNGLNKVFRASNLKVEIIEGKPEYPYITSYTQLEDCIHQFTLKLPAGLSWKDIETKKDKVEQYFKGEVKVFRRNGEVVVNILTGELSWPMDFDKSVLNYREALKLSFILGEGRKGILRLDLATFPHLLVGGQTGGGKSVCLRLILTTLMLTHSPENLRVHLVDLKGGVEFSLFEEMPHIETFATEEEVVYDLLDEIITEYGNRLNLFREAGVTNITEYRELGNFLPFIMVVFDEFAELNPQEGSKKMKIRGMTQNELRLEIHAKVSRLLRLARATGIHLVIATQRPDANALPGQLKANIPVTIAFRTRNRINSQILLDTDSACSLDSVSGRAILQIGNEEQEIQVMYMPPQMSRELLTQHG